MPSDAALPFMNRIDSPLMGRFVMRRSPWDRQTSRLFITCAAFVLSTPPLEPPPPSPRVKITFSPTLISSTADESQTAPMPQREQQQKKKHCAHIPRVGARVLFPSRLRSVRCTLRKWPPCRLPSRTGASQSGERVESQGALRSRFTRKVTLKLL